MHIAYEIGRGGYWTGNSIEVGDRDGIPGGWTRATMPSLEPGEFAVWRGGRWVITTDPPNVPPSPPPPTITEGHVIAERERRLALGFDYDFGDARGVHRIGTTPKDMQGWDRVTKLKDAMYQAGLPDAPMTTIWTETGQAQVTAAEWSALLLWAAQNHEQPLWLASFALQAMDPIPADYADDSYWM